eukprot:symbB.v1.2.035241.t1/scaffold4697.1/size36212/2
MTSSIHTLHFFYLQSYKKSLMDPCWFVLLAKPSRNCGSSFGHLPRSLFLLASMGLASCRKSWSRAESLTSRLSSKLLNVVRQDWQK